MIKDNFDKLERIKTIGDGRNGFIYLSKYNGNICTCKDFATKEYIKLINDKMSKLIEYYKKDSSLVFPFKFLYNDLNDDYFDSYLTEYKDGYKDLYEFYNLDYKEKVRILKKIRLLIHEMHEVYKVIHTDLYDNNIMYNKDLDSVCIIDFDSYIDINSKEGYLGIEINFLSRKYIENTGIDQSVDVFMFNLLCYSFLNNVDFYDVINYIYKGEYGVLTDNRIINVLKSYKFFDCRRKVKKEYILDYI